MATKRRTDRAARVDHLSATPKDALLLHDGQADAVREDDPSDPDNGDPSSWPAWTDRHRYAISRS